MKNKPRLILILLILLSFIAPIMNGEMIAISYYLNISQLLFFIESIVGFFSEPLRVLLTMGGFPHNVSGILDNLTLALGQFILFGTLLFWIYDIPFLLLG